MKKVCAYNQAFTVGGSLIINELTVYELSDALNPYSDALYCQKLYTRSSSWIEINLRWGKSCGKAISKMNFTNYILWYYLTRIPSK